MKARCILHEKHNEFSGVGVGAGRGCILINHSSFLFTATKDVFLARDHKKINLAKTPTNTGQEQRADTPVRGESLRNCDIQSCAYGSSTAHSFSLQQKMSFLQGITKRSTLPKLHFKPHLTQARLRPVLEEMIAHLAWWGMPASKKPTAVWRTSGKPDANFWMRHWEASGSLFT